MSIEGRYEQVAMGPLGKGAGIVARPTIVSPEGAPLFILTHDQTAIRADPQPSTGIQMKVDDPIARQLGRVAGIKARELYAIKARQPAESAEPEIAI